ncbi:hypothetical protein GGTG_01455 [Gaeumannomyces tritici R3-111a-1]|uniref:Uncharacterized protein n=1 Tax=Gaeumannomyces tritici (strain R3-111a-1) TaxID=644352 RepID=J3NJM5_GAET3|nr:hypothetical protein GGTG_01455 [Gaeumannomyces tritici R3-111a-1]EJT81477.1 hypothetical protein GGTG_01455 [Gaeumannomyces tritici R3-111a-1]
MEVPARATATEFAVAQTAFETAQSPSLLLRLPAVCALCLHLTTTPPILKASAATSEQSPGPNLTLLYSQPTRVTLIVAPPDTFFFCWDHYGSSRTRRRIASGQSRANAPLCLVRARVLNSSGELWPGLSRACQLGIEGVLAAARLWFVAKG